MTEEDFRAAALNFSWLEEGLVAGCRGPRTDEDLAWLADAAGIRCLVRLAPDDEIGFDGSEVEQHAIRDLYEPVRDWTAPSQRKLDRAIAFIKAAAENGDPVAVSCGAGCGRTGTVLACYLVAKGLPPQAAINRLVALRPCSREIERVPGQKDAVFDFYRNMKNLGPSRDAV